MGVEKGRARERRVRHPVGSGWVGTKEGSSFLLLSLPHPGLGPRRSQAEEGLHLTGTGHLRGGTRWTENKLGN